LYRGLFEPRRARQGLEGQRAAEPPAISIRHPKADGRSIRPRTRCSLLGRPSTQSVASNHVIQSLHGPGRECDEMADDTGNAAGPGPPPPPPTCRGSKGTLSLPHLVQGVASTTTILPAKSSTRGARVGRARPTVWPPRPGSARCRRTRFHWYEIQLSGRHTPVQAATTVSLGPFRAKGIRPLPRT